MADVIAEIYCNIALLIKQFQTLNYTLFYKIKSKLYENLIVNFPTIFLTTVFEKYFTSLAKFTLIVYNHFSTLEEVNCR